MKRKILLSMIAAIILTASVSVGAFAAVSLPEVKAYLNNAVKITLDGKQWTPTNSDGKPVTPLTYNNTTYLPLRAVAEAAGLGVGWDATSQTAALGDTYDAMLEFPADKYPQTAAHVASAILAGESAICTINRTGADPNRDKSLSGIPTKDGYDRDEWPMAMCEEGGSGADIAYVESGDNRGAGSWMGNQLSDYPDGTRVKFVVTFGVLDADANRSQSTTENGNAEVEYSSCSAVKAAGAAPIYRGDTGYSTKLDRDGDGVACES